LHYSDAEIRKIIERLIEREGPTILVTVDQRSWLVPRHYIALHGLRATEIASLGFEEVSNAQNSL
jgi:hypothetical protein